MICEDCGVSMQWRCTDNITRVSKFKCPNCGHVQMGKLDMKPIVEHNPKYYHEKNGAWIVKNSLDPYYYLYVAYETLNSNYFVINLFLFLRYF